MNFLERARKQFTIAHVGGVPIRADLGWLLVIVVMTIITAVSINSIAKDLSISLLLGSVVTTLFIISVFIHEYAHAIAAKLESHEVAEIILHPFGGATRFKRQPQTPRAEFRIAIAGPLASFLLAVIFGGAIILFNSFGADIAAQIFFLMALTNLLLALFNMLPGYPLDGGRVLRAVLWKNGRTMSEATVLTGRCGQFIGGILVFFGIFSLFVRGDLFTGGWAIMVGIFLFNSASAVIAETNNIGLIRIEDIMRLPITVDPELKLVSFFNDILPVYRLRTFPVAKNGDLFGILSLQDLKQLPKSDWHTTTVKQVMRPIAAEFFVEMGAKLAEVVELMSQNGLNSIAVTDNKGKLVGFLYTENLPKTL